MISVKGRTWAGAVEWCRKAHDLRPEELKYTQSLAFYLNEKGDKEEDRRGAEEGEQVDLAPEGVLRQPRGRKPPYHTISSRTPSLPGRLDCKFANC